MSSLTEQISRAELLAEIERAELEGNKRYTEEQAAAAAYAAERTKDNLLTAQLAADVLKDACAAMRVARDKLEEYDTRAREAEAEREFQRQAAERAAHAAHVNSLVARGAECSEMFLNVLDELRSEPAAFAELKNRLRALGRGAMDAVSLNYEPAYFMGGELVNRPRIELEIHRVLGAPASTPVEEAAE